MVWRACLLKDGNQLARWPWWLVSLSWDGHMNPSCGLPQPISIFIYISELELEIASSAEYWRYIATSCPLAPRKIFFLSSPTLFSFMNSIHIWLFPHWVMLWLALWVLSSCFELRLGQFCEFYSYSITSSTFRHALISTPGPLFLLWAKIRSAVYPWQPWGDLLLCFILLFRV